MVDMIPDYQPCFEFQVFGQMEPKANQDFVDILYFEDRHYVVIGSYQYQDLQYLMFLVV